MTILFDYSKVLNYYIIHIIKKRIGIFSKKSTDGRRGARILLLEKFYAESSYLWNCRLLN